MRNHAKFVLTGLCACTAAALTLGPAGCASNSKKSEATSSGAKVASAKADNAMCPVGGNPVSASAPTVAYKGKTVGFCCAKCIPEWQKMSDAMKDSKLKAAMAAK